jgi:hypothetical protein
VLATSVPTPDDVVASLRQADGIISVHVLATD